MITKSQFEQGVYEDKQVFDLIDENARLRAELSASEEAYTELGNFHRNPKQPTIVKQTWQVIVEGVVSDHKHYYSGYWLEEVKQVLRTDHMSDGSVKCELESV